MNSYFILVIASLSLVGSSLEAMQINRAHNANAPTELQIVVIEQQVDLQVQNTFMQAAQNGDLATCKNLVASVDVNGTDATGKTALMLASQHGHLDVCRYLAPRVKVAQADPNGLTALMLAAQAGHAEVCLLLAPLCNVNQQADNGMRALHFATQAGHDEVVRVLIANYAKIDATTGFVPESGIGPEYPGTTALHLAVQGRHYGTAQLLVEHVNRSIKAAFEYIKCMKQLAKQARGPYKNAPHLFHRWRKYLILPYLDVDCLPKSTKALLDKPNAQNKTAYELLTTEPHPPLMPLYQEGVNKEQYFALLTMINRLRNTQRV